MVKGKYFWLKLDRNFFKRHDIQIVESMPNGKDYVLFYLKLLVESIDHEGLLRFNEMIPYNESMLSIITNTNVDIVRSAIKVFQELKLMEMLDDKTIYLKETNKMLGESSSTHRVQEFRQRKKQEMLTNGNVTETLHETEIEIEKELEIDIEREKDIKSVSPIVDSKRFIPPTLDEVIDYCLTRGNQIDANRFIAFYESKGWMIGKNKMKNWKSAIHTWELKDNDKPRSKQQLIDDEKNAQFMEIARERGYDVK